MPLLQKPAETFRVDKTRPDRHRRTRFHPANSALPSKRNPRPAEANRESHPLSSEHAPSDRHEASRVSRSLPTRLLRQSAAANPDTTEKTSRHPAAKRSSPAALLYTAPAGRSGSPAFAPEDRARPSIRRSSFQTPALPPPRCRSAQHNF